MLPFTDMSPGKDQAYFCEGMAEEIINALTGVAGLRVAARSSAFRFKAGERDLREIGRALDVSLILEGSVRTAGNRLRVTAQLNEAQSGYQIWSRRYDRGVDDVFATQDEIAADLVQALKPDLGSAAAPLVVRHTENQEAYHLYLRGRHYWYARSPGALQKALRYFEEATEKDPDYALPYVGLADLYTVQGSLLLRRCRRRFGRAPGRPFGGRSRSTTSWLTRIGPSGSRSCSTIGTSGPAVRSFERSIELDPASALSHIWLGWATWPGREQRPSPRRGAPKPSIRSTRISPAWSGPSSISGDTAPTAVEEGQKALDLDPHNLVGRLLTAAILTRLGRHDAALPLFARAIEISARAPFIVGYQALGPGECRPIGRGAISPRGARGPRSHRTRVASSQGHRLRRPRATRSRVRPAERQRPRC